MGSRLAPSFLPSTAILELTYRCNHKCLFCSCPWYADRGFEVLDELSTEDWKSTISKCCDMGVMNLALTGGEPLLRDDLYEIIEHACGCETEHIETVNGELIAKFAPPKIYLLSNGMLVDEKLLKFCKEKDVQLSMSLPGLSAFGEHTGKENADHVLEMFRKSKQIGLDTVVNVTATKLNLHELRENIAAAFLAGASQLLLNRFIPGGRGLENAERLSLSKDEIDKMLETAEEVLVDAGRFGHLGTELPRCIFNPDKFKKLTVSTGCSAAIQFFVIGPSGYIRVCNHSEKRLSHIDQVDDLKNNEYWKIFTQKKYLPEICFDCEAATACDGGCREAAHVFKGNVNSTDVVFLNQTPQKI